MRAKNKKQSQLNKDPNRMGMTRYEHSIDIARLFNNPIPYSQGIVEFGGDNNIVPIQYMQNQYGFRTPEFNNQELMTLGCSYTYGIGLPENFRWSNQLAKNLNMEYVNLARPGDSVMGQVRYAFWYFRNFGHPKVIAAIFPINRMQIPLVQGFTASKHEAFKGGRKEQYATIPLYIYPEELVDFSQKPHEYEGVLPQEVPAYMSNVFVDLLDQYCKSHGIKFIWSYWEQGPHTLELMHEYSEMLYDSYVPLKSLSMSNKDGWEAIDFIGQLQCHSEFKDHPLFNRAADRQGEEQLSHWGIHKNIHIANELTKKIKHLLSEE
jgi:hypothetical protein